VNCRDVTTAVFAQWSDCVKSNKWDKANTFALIRTFPVPHTLSSEYNIVNTLWTG